jgi:large-conductance mechanosensitive channel
MEFNNFFYEEGIIGITIGTITAFAIGNFVKEIKVDFLTPVIAKNKFLHQFYLLPSLIELFIMFFTIFVLYHYVLQPIFHKEIVKEKEEKIKEKKWKEDIIQEIRNLNLSKVYL